MTKYLFAAAAGIVALASAPLVSLADDASTPSAIIAAAQKNDQQPVTVTGTIKNSTTQQGRRGPVVMYDLCDAQCVHVIAPGGAAVKDGSQATVSGMFIAHVDRGQMKADNVVFVRPPNAPSGPPGPPNAPPPPSNAASPTP
ncbi:MAG: hypothetical protein ACXVAG_12465 [Vulcanimicrobiaceae bacterium]